MDVAVAIDAVFETLRVSLRKPGLIRVVIPCPVVYQTAGVGFSAGVAVLYYAAALGDCCAEGVEALRGRDGFAAAGIGLVGFHELIDYCPGVFVDERWGVFGGKG